MNFIVYLSTGEITRVGSCPERDVPLQGTGTEQVLEGEGEEETHWVEAGMLAVRPLLPLLIPNSAVVGDPISLSPIPAGTTVSIIGEGVRLKGRPMTFPLDTIVFNDTGQYILTFNNFPYRVLEVQINVN